jgi:O-antigen/teichoic acid export membrane protein
MSNPAENMNELNEPALSDNSFSEKHKTAQDKISKKVISGSFWTLLGLGVSNAASFIAIPFVIRLLGAELYGVLALINLTLGYIGFADFGMGTASTRFASQAHSKNDQNEEVSVIWTALLLSLVPTLIVALILLFFSDVIVGEILKISPELHSVTSLALSLVSVVFVFRVVNNIINTPQLVRFKLHTNTLIVAGTATLQIIITPIIIWFGGGVIGAVVCMIFFSLVAFVCHLTASRRLLPEIIKPQINIELVKSLLIFGGSLLASSAAAILLVNMEKLILTRFSSLSVLAHYSVAFTLAGMLTIVPGALVQSLLPAFSQLQAAEHKESLQKLFSQTIRINLLWLPPVILILLLGAKPIFTIWAGAEFGRESVIPFYILLGGVITNVIAYVPSCLIMAFGKVNNLAKLYWLELIPYAFLTIFLTSEYGAVGAALAWSLRVFVDAIVFFIMAKRIIYKPFITLLGVNKRYLIVLLIMSLPSISVITFFDSIELIVFSAIISIAIYMLSVWSIFLSENERVLIKSYVTRFSSNIK